MKIMLVSTIRGKESNINAIKIIAKVLEKNKHTVFSDHLLEFSQDNLDNMSEENNLAFHNKILSQIRHCDIVVAECSHESFSVGYLLSHAIELGKPTIIFYDSQSRKPNLVPTLMESGKLLLAEYESLEELGDMIPEYIDYAKEKVDVRFNFFVSPAISRYLDWISRVKKIPRSVYLRALIEKEIEQNEEYQEAEKKRDI